MDKVIQIANICEEACNVLNPIPGRVYYAKGCSPAINTCGGVEKTDVFMDKAKVTTHPRLRYALGRSNHGNENDKYGTNRFRANPYFNTVTAIQMSNRRQWIVEIQSNSPT